MLLVDCRRLGLSLVMMMAACQLTPTQPGNGERQPAQNGPTDPGTPNGEMMTVKFHVPPLTEFKTARGDGSGILTHFAFKLEALEPQCTQYQNGGVANYSGPREERISVPRLCRMRIKFALGGIENNQFSPMFESNAPTSIEPQIWLSGREAAINYTMIRLSAGQARGFTATTVNVFFPGQGPSAPTGATGPQTPTNPTIFPTPGPTPPVTNNGRQIDFRIKAGTGNGAWNDASTAVSAKVGQVVRIYNDDSVVHQLHTDGAPCGHGNPIRPGAFEDCVIRSPYNGQPLYDHGTRGAFFISAGR